MCDYQELRIAGRRADMRDMQSQQIKVLVESGQYRPEPSRVAEAMLRRRGVRELLMHAPQPLSAAGRTPTAPAPGRQAA